MTISLAALELYPASPSTSNSTPSTQPCPKTRRTLSMLIGFLVLPHPRVHGALASWTPTRFGFFAGSLYMDSAFAPTAHPIGYAV